MVVLRAAWPPCEAGEAHRMTVAQAARLHAWRRVDAEQPEPARERPSGQIAEDKPTLARLALRAQDRTALVERRKGRRQVEEVAGQRLELQRLGDLGADRREAQQLEGQRPLGGLGDRDGRNLTRRLDPGSPEDRADPGVGILEVRRRVAVERE